MKIHCWLLLQKSDRRGLGTLIYFHGNAGNMGFRLKNAAEMYARVGINVLMVDYRGYGSSTGTVMSILNVCESLLVACKAFQRKMV